MSPWPSGDAFGAFFKGPRLGRGMLGSSDQLSERLWGPPTWWLCHEMRP